MSCLRTRSLSFISADVSAAIAAPIGLDADVANRSMRGRPGDWTLPNQTPKWLPNQNGSRIAATAIAPVAHIRTTIVVSP